MSRWYSRLLRAACVMVIGALWFPGHAPGAMVTTERSLNPYPRRKEIPAFTSANLAPPYLEHSYFEDHDWHPFQAHAAAFDLANAWWLAEASTLAYADEIFAANWFRKGGLSEVRFFDKRSTQCFVANNRDVAVVAFRGSEVWKRRSGFDAQSIAADFMTNADFRLADWENGGKVHRGFKKALDEVWEELFPYLAALQRRGCKIWMTGHSLGAALATLAADRFGEVQGVYTFGSPRVGNRRFMENYSTRAYRFVNGDDIVSRVPPSGLYVHVGEPKFIDHGGVIRTGSASPAKGSPPLAGEYGEEPIPGNSHRVKAPLFVPDSVIDHVPLLYAVMIWNRLVDLRQAPNRSPLHPD